MATGKLPDQIRFDFVRSPFFRVVHSNGAWGGITPLKEFSVTFYSERLSPPKHITHELTPEGLGPEVDRAETTSIQREFEVEVLMSMQEAIKLHSWLGTKIEEWRKIGPSIAHDISSEAQ